MSRALASLVLIAAMVAPGAALAAQPCPERVLEDGCCEREPTPDSSIAGLCCCTIRELPGAISAVDSPALAPERSDCPATLGVQLVPAPTLPVAAPLQIRLPTTARAPPTATLLSLHTSLVC